MQRSTEKGRFLDRFDGILALIWMVTPGLLLSSAYKMLFSRFPAEPGILILMFLMWLGLGLLLLIAEFRRGLGFWRRCAIGVAVLLFYSLEPYHRVGLSIANLSRKNEYGLIYPGAPELQLQVRLRDNRDVILFRHVLQDFTKEQGIHQCKQPLYLAYSGRARPDFKGEHVVMWVGVSVTQPNRTGSIRLGPHDRGYSVDDFTRVARSLQTSMQRAFPERAQSTFKAATVEPGLH